MFYHTKYTIASKDKMNAKLSTNSMQMRTWALLSTPKMIFRICLPHLMHIEVHDQYGGVQVASLWILL